MIRESVCVCLCIHVHVAGPTSSMGVNFISQETSTILYCGDEFPRDIECCVCYRCCSGCSWRRCHGGHFCARPLGLLLTCGGSGPIRYSDKAARLLLGRHKPGGFAQFLWLLGTSRAGALLGWPTPQQWHLSTQPFC